ncbi:hypothetical protein G3572_12470 [Rhodobacter sp. ETT8]|uniref:Aspartyl-trna synthetase n=2 Tax=Pseudotabrizicola algicola TaxID=2709381 RepID=A0A6B3RP96_9RHOB|nr:hypothetical protein [Pseudotabrizicola algicola]
MVLGVALIGLASGAWAQTVRPKPRPVPVAATLAPVPSERAETAETEETPEATDLPLTATEATGAPPASLPAGPPAPRTAAAAPPPRDPNKGAVTNLPLPRFVSLKSGEGNARRGPGLSHRIDWVFTRVGMPLKITAEHGHWRRVEDAEGLGGWVHYALLSGVRSVMVADDMATFYSRPDTASLAAFQAERGVVARIISCKDGWCRVSVDNQRGWAPVSSLWGVGADEVID